MVLISSLLANIVGIASIDKDRDSTLQDLRDFEMIGLEPIPSKQKTERVSRSIERGKDFRFMLVLQDS
jgi:hypothetical protein